MLLPAFVRAHEALYSVGRSTEEAMTGDECVAVVSALTFKGATPWRLPGRLVVSSEELRRWQQTELSDRRAVLKTAYIRVLIDAEGKVHPLWRHEAEGA